MSTIAPTEPAPFSGQSAPLPRSLYRLSIEKYEAMVRFGMFTKRDRLELIDGFLVAKMTEHPSHASVCEMTRYALERVLPKGWHLRGEKPLRIPSKASLLKPDLVVARGACRDYLRRHPEPADVALVIEVADASLDDDRHLMTRVYGGGGVGLYWIVNLINGQIEVYSGPSGPSEPVGYRHCEVYRPGQEIPLDIEGTEAGRISVADLLP
jgi:Uma2 family endonuclease